MKTQIYEIINIIMYDTLCEEDLQQFFEKMNSYKVSSKNKLNLIDEIVESVIEELVVIEDYELCDLLVEFKNVCHKNIGKKRNRQTIQ